MGKALIIAEKPSVAADIARVLGGFAKQGDYFESERYVLSSAVGHLVEIAAPEQFEVKRGKWSFAHLPVIPPHFDLKPIEKSAERLKLLTRLMDPSEGRVLLDGVDVRRIAEASLRSSVVLVPQEGFLFDDTLLANVRYGRLDATEADVLASADELG